MSTNIYILQLEGGNYYVGKSDNPAQRLDQHLKGKGASWTKIHRPVKLVKVIENASHFDEDKHSCWNYDTHSDGNHYSRYYLAPD